MLATAGLGLTDIWEAGRGGTWRTEETEQLLLTKLLHFLSISDLAQRSSLSAHYRPDLMSKLHLTVETDGTPGKLLLPGGEGEAGDLRPNIHFQASNTMQTWVSQLHSP